MRKLAVLMGWVALGAGIASAQFTEPTKEELTMTSIAEVPGAPAVYLYKEQTTDDNLHMWSYYFRVKVLTDGGKDYANVELPYFAGYTGISIDSISGRTIQPDGTVVAFTGKPYDKLLEKGSDYQFKAKVFTLPAVQVGSILEYRYKFRFDDGYFIPPDWYLQTALYTRKAHYLWRPADYFTGSDAGTAERAAWTPILPPGAQIIQTSLPNSGMAIMKESNLKIELDVHDIMPLPKEEYMPPMNSLSYRVLFYYTAAKTAQEYWNTTGKRWSGEMNKFMSTGGAVKEAVKNLVGPSDTDEVKAKKIYDFVMKMENTKYTRARSTQEEKSQGLKTVTTAEDVLKRQRGTPDQIAELYVAMARAAGMKAYLMRVTNRDDSLFNPTYLSPRQLDDDIAIVSIGGKEVFLDPGQRYCTFAHLAWWHTLTGGLRQKDDGVMVGNTPAEGFAATHISRVADLTLDEHGSATGTVSLSYTGDSALRWRQRGLKGDEASLNTELRQTLERMLPGGMEVKVLKVDNLTDSDKPLDVKFEVSGSVGTSTGKRLLVPANLFEVNNKPAFTTEKREIAVDMHFPRVNQDAVRFKYPKTLVIESSPAADSIQLKGMAAFTENKKESPEGITMFRNLTIGKTYFAAADYAELRTFYGKFESKDQETLVFVRSSGAAAAGGN